VLATLASKKRFFVSSPIGRLGVVSRLKVLLELLRECMDEDFAVELSLVLDVLLRVLRRAPGVVGSAGGANEDALGEEGTIGDEASSDDGY